MTGLIDCDVHHAVPEISALFPYLPSRWSDYCVEHGVQSLAPDFYPPNMALSARPESRTGTTPPGSDPAVLRTQVLDDAPAELAIVNCLYAVQPIHNEDWAVAMAAGLNDWQADQWLDADPRLRASIVVPPQNPARAAAEIRRMADQPGFVQVLLLAFSEMPLGRRHYWPIYEAAAEAGLPVGVHPGVAGANPLSPVGWPSYCIEDYAGVSNVMQSQLISLVCEGVFQQYPNLRVVLLESGVSWLPSLLWRLDKNWKGTRREVPWVTVPPSEVIREHVRFTVAPFDGPPETADVLRLVEQLGSADVLLYASDYPHWHHRDAATSLLRHLSADDRAKVERGNAEALYGL
ncbi:amidohydrolase [Saccharopolyspora sp. K220]|uniref:amidohydrolase family protein n=1 Tax=Saccharopolyspora soli TaxID=2926618 RepID=UPI001F56FDA3|nr:amidohydrolase family protein [Saccharopolyspora soli]MCI2417334.1 amidohydrolase [Saccharopolyspora soli]